LKTYGGAGRKSPEAYALNPKGFMGCSPQDIGFFFLHPYIFLPAPPTFFFLHPTIL